MTELQGEDREGQVEVFELLSDEGKASLVTWCKTRLYKGGGKHTSYRLKHMYLAETEYYVYTGSMKKALELAGFKPDKTLSINWHYNVSLRKRGAPTVRPVRSPATLLLSN